MKTDLREKNVSAAETGEDSLNWRYQDKEYNESYKEWRRRKQDSLGFYFVENPNLLTYQDGVGFIKDYPEAHEAKTMQRVLMVLSGMLLFLTAFDIFSSNILPLLLERLGADIHYDFYAKALYGDYTLILTIRLISGILKRVIPIWFLLKKFEMPLSVMIPTKITNKPMFKVCVPSMLLVSGVCCVLTYFYEQILSFMHIDTSRASMIPEGGFDLIYFLIIQAVIIPIVSEISIHGVVLQLTRQFGDGTALLITSFISASIQYDITKSCYVFVSSLIIGYFVIRTGSVVTAVLMRMTLAAYTCTVYLLDYRVEHELGLTLTMAFLFLTIMIGLIFMVRFICSHGDRFGMTIKPRYLDFGAKLIAIVTNIPMIIWLTLVFILTLSNIKIMM